MRDRVWKLIGLREGEAAAVFLSFLYFFFLLSSFYILRPLRDEMGLRGGVEHLQWLFTGTFAGMLIAVPLYHAMVARFPKKVFLPWVYRFFILNILLFWLCFHLDFFPVWTARVFFIWASVFNLFVVSVFWSVMVDIFSTKQGKRLFGFIAAGGTAGALTGPVITMLLAIPLGPANLLLISASLLEAAVQCVSRLLKKAKTGANKPSAPSENGGFVGGSVFSGIRQVFMSAYLAKIVLFILLMTTCATFFYFTQANLVYESFEDTETRTTVFAIMDFLINTLTIVTQLFLTGRFLTRFGLPAGLALVPAITMTGFLALSILPLFAVFFLFQVSRRGFNFAISRPARENLFTIVPLEQKYKSKNFIDTVVYRGGDAVSAWLFQALTAAGAAVMIAGALIAFAWMLTGIHLGKQCDKASGGKP